MFGGAAGNGKVARKLVVFEQKKDVSDLNYQFLMFLRSVPDNELGAMISGLKKEDVQWLRNMSLSDLRELSSKISGLLFTPKLNFGSLKVAVENEVETEFAIAKFASEVAR